MSEPHEVIRPLSKIREQLTELRSAMADLEDVATTDFAARVTLASLRANESVLLNEEASAVLADDGHSLEIVLEGDAVVRHTIGATFLSDVLGRFQRLLDGVAQAREGQSTRVGRVPEDIRSGVRMMVAAMVPGSFAVRIDIPDQAEQLFGDDVLRATLNLFAAEPAVESFVPLMRLPRVKSSYEELAKSLVLHSSEVRFRTRTGESAHFTAQMARERLDWIALVETAENTLDVRGTLVGGNVESKTYVLAVDDEHYRGRILDTALDELRRVALGASVRARLLRIVKAQVDDIVAPREEFYLEAIKAAVDMHQESF